MKKLIIDRKIWFRGQGSGPSRLLRQDGRRCCLGIALGCEGVPDEAMLDQHSPRAIPGSWVDNNASYGWLLYNYGGHDNRDFVKGNSPAGEDLMNFNDQEDLDEEVREYELTQRFALQGIKVEFIN